METQAVSEQESKVKDTLLFAGGYASALADSDARVGYSQLVKLKELLDKAVEMATRVTLHVRHIVERAQEMDEKELRNFLARTTEAVEALRPFSKMRAEILRKAPGLGDYWTEDHQRAMNRSLEVFEEAEETIALGLSLSFQSEIKEARNEAGIEANGKNKLPTD